MSHLIQSQPIPAGTPITYSLWYDEPVVLRFSTARNHSLERQLRCTITNESAASVHIHVGGKEQDISKCLILAVEETAVIPGLRHRQ